MIFKYKNLKKQIKITLNLKMRDPKIKLLGIILAVKQRNVLKN